MRFVAYATPCWKNSAKVSGINKHVSEQQLPLEERRLALDARKVEQDYEIRRRELDLKAAERGRFASFTPLTSTILAGVITVAGSVYANYRQGQMTLQNELILKMVDVGNAAQARNNLQFLIDTKLVSDALAKRIRLAPTVAVTGAINVAGKTFEAIQTDDEAIDLILKWEGGYVEMPPPNDQDASNEGITVQELANFLGHPATKDDLKKLNSDTAKAIYKQLFLQPMAGINSPLVRAAYLNLAIWTGMPNAVKLLQAAAARVLDKAVNLDGVVGPASVLLINSVPTPDLLVETANCLQLDALKMRADYHVFGDGWLSRLRAFSPATLSGVCSDLGIVQDPLAAQSDGR